MKTLARAFTVFLCLFVWGCTQQVDETITEDDMSDSKGAQSGNQQSPSGGWSKTAELSVGQSKDINQSLQAVFPVAGDYTVQFGNPSIPGVRVKADITWSVEGNSFKRTVNVGDGVAVTGTAQGVKVVAYDDTAVGGPAAGTKYTVPIACAPGVRANTQKPPTLYDDNSRVVLAPTSFVDLPIPTNSGVISINFQLAAHAAAQTPVASGNLLVSFKVGATLIMTVDPAAADGWIPIPPGADSWNITNNSTTDTYEVSYVWGIDG